jgi:hypothetical protein
LRRKVDQKFRIPACSWRGVGQGWVQRKSCHGYDKIAVPNSASLFTSPKLISNTSKSQATILKKKINTPYFCTFWALSIRNCPILNPKKKFNQRRVFFPHILHLKTKQMGFFPSIVVAKRPMPGVSLYSMCPAGLCPHPMRHCRCPRRSGCQELTDALAGIGVNVAAEGLCWPPLSPECGS